MNIIIEGPDATGKTTLAEKLVKKFGFYYEHLTSKTPNDLQYHLDLLDRDCYVYDRFMFGEIVYPVIYNRKPKISFNDADTIMKKIIANDDIFIVFITSDIDVLKDRLRERGEFNYLEEIKQQNKEFLKLAYAFIAYEYPRFFVVNVANNNCYDKLEATLEKLMNTKTTNVVYQKVCQDLIDHGVPVSVEASRGHSVELTNYKFTIDDISNSIVTLKSRNTSLNYLAGELLWYWSGRNDVNFIEKFAKMWGTISDDGSTNNSAYGYIIQKKHGFNQIEKIIELLRKDPLSRRAVINLNVPNENVIETKDEMCTVCLQFLLRDNKLNCTAFMRSNDVIFGLTYDMTYFMTLQKYIADKLRVGYGTYTHFVTSLHYYLRDKILVANVANGDLRCNDETLYIEDMLQPKMMSKLIDYVDNHWKSKDDFTDYLRALKLIGDVAV